MLGNLIPFKNYIALGAIILLAAMVGVHLYHDMEWHERALSAESALAAETALAKARKTEIEKTKQEAIDAIAKVAADRDDMLKKFNLVNINRTTEQEKVRALNDKLNQSQEINDRTRANLNDSLRLAAKRDSTRMSEEPKTTSELPNDQRDSDIATLREACRVTTIDLMTCIGITNSDTATVGREK